MLEWRRGKASLTGSGLTYADDWVVEPGSDEWLRTALYACVTQLPGSITEGSTVEVLAAWIDENRSLCFVYQYSYYDGVLGLRCDTETDMYGDPSSDPTRFGEDVADFAIGEPLGTVADHLRQDDNGVYWWGSVTRELPRLPESPRLREVIARAAVEHERRRAEKADMPRDGHLARRSEGSEQWMLIAKPFGETWYLTDDEASASDDEIKQRFNLASLTRGDHWAFTLRSASDE